MLTTAVLVLMCALVHQASPAALAKQVLAEVPDQVCRYFQLNNVPPGVRPTASSASAAVPVQQAGPAPSTQSQGLHP